MQTLSTSHAATQEPLQPEQQHEQPLQSPPLPPQQPQQPAGLPAPVHVLHGTCGWSDALLVRCGRFYPAGVRSTEEKLRHYSRHFGCVEIDTSTYAIPRPEVAARWAAATSPAFTFVIKCFGLFTAGSCQVSALPAEAHALLPPAVQAQPQAHVRLGGGCPPAVEDACWRAFHAACEPLYAAGKLGAVLFQFHLSFTPSADNLQRILRCRRRLDPRFRMAVEVRCRSWLSEPAWRARLCKALAAQGVGLASADELAHETAQKDREQSGLPAGATRRVLPVALEVTTPEFHLCRVHRRHGTTDRLLPQAEVADWAERLAQLAPRLRGPIWFLWGTDWEDVPMINARNLDAALLPQLRLDWRQQCRAAPPRRGSIASMLARAAAAPGAAGVAPGADSEPDGSGGRASTAAPQASQVAGRKREREGAAVSGARRGGSILRFLQPAAPSGDNA